MRAAAKSVGGSSDAQRFLNALLIEPRVKLEATVVTAADRGYFPALQCLIASVRVSHECTLRVVDLGLTERQRRWCVSQGCQVVKPPRLIVPRSRFMWQTWNKPLYLAGVDAVIWLDADCLVTGSLAWLDKLLSDRPAMITDTAAVHWCGWQEGCRTLANGRQLYDDFPVLARFGDGEAPNAGVIAFDPSRPRDKKILETWLSMVRRAAKDSRLLKRSRGHDKQGWLAWYDQGALQWTLEKLGERELVIHDTRFNDPVSASKPKDFADLCGKIERLKTTRIVHFPSGLKPYGQLPKAFDPDTRGYPANRTDLTLFVLGHERQGLKNVNAPCLKTVYLPAINTDNDLAESRIFQSNILKKCESEYIGLCTARWNEKYTDECRPLAELHRLKLGVSTVWAARPAKADWLAMSERDHPGMRRIVERVAERMNVRNLQRSAPWSNNLIAHRSVVQGLQEWLWRGLGVVAAEFGPRPKYGMRGWDKSRVGSYLAERISMLYFCMRDDLEIKQVPL